MSQSPQGVKELFLVHVSAENGSLHLLIVNNRSGERANFHSMQSAFSYIERETGLTHNSLPNHSTPKDAHHSA